MRTIITSMIMAVACLVAQAQQIWTEGTMWEIHTERTDYFDEIKTEVYTYELGESISFNDTLYYTLTETYEGVSHVVSYLRAEGDDAYVYARHFHSEELMIYTGEQSEILLYDFSKPFEYGDTMQYSTYGGCMVEEYIDPESTDELRYFYDVIEPGDCLPAYHNIIYKIGSVFGPIAKLFLTYGETETGNVPNPKNVSHILFKTKGKPNGSMITLRIDAVRTDNPSCLYYRLTGLQSTDHQPLFKKGNVFFCR